MINISSTPIPSIKTGSASCASVRMWSSSIPMANPAPTESNMQMTPTIATLILQCVGLHEPKKIIRYAVISPTL